MSTNVSRAVVVAGLVGAGVYAVLSRRTDLAWLRTNHAGRAVTLYAGPAAVLGAAAGTAAAPGPARARAAGVLAVLAAGGCGAYDDLVGAEDPRRGFRAHLGALRGGEVTSGAVKLFGIGAAGVLAGLLIEERAVDGVLTGVVIAGTALGVALARRGGRRGDRTGRAALAVGLVAAAANGERVSGIARRASGVLRRVAVKGAAGHGRWTVVATSRLLIHP
ncbi:hypothetical protein [Streptomyces arboris]|uniref:hypothetical protein n=1 Tax=Streptomyces arboris TaxID=2600619 RepID=UPI001CEF7D0D|nr:hypothetical protein [Streptomyces arboris]